MKDGKSRSEPRHLPEIPGFDMLRCVGRGGFGRVYLATNQTTGMLRAVKVIPLQHTGRVDPAGREVASLTRLEANIERRHPNLVTVDHVSRTDEYLYYVMDPADDVSGDVASADEGYRPATLRSLLERGPLRPPQCERFARELLSGLASLHEVGMVHRDVKPANCLLVGGVLKLADFGLLTEAGPQVSRAGTETYMPPDGHMDTRADVYAAGLVMYEMITGLPAECFPHLGERAEDLSANAEMRKLVRVILQACQQDPKLRYRDASAMLNAMDTSPRDGGLRGLSSLHRTAAAAVVIAVALVLGVFAWQKWSPVETTPALPERVNVNFITEKPYFDAEIYLNGHCQLKPDGTSYKTPCTIGDLAACEHEVEFHLEGQKPLDAGSINFARTRHVVGTWSEQPR